VAPLGLPFFDSFRADALPAYGHAGHVVGRVHRKEQDKGKQVDADQYQHPVQQPPQYVGSHAFSPSQTPASAVARSRRRMMRMAGYMPRSAAANRTHKGHQMGGFQLSIRSARKAGSMRRYCKVLRTI